MMPRLFNKYVSKALDMVKRSGQRRALTWVARLTIGTKVVSRNAVNEILQDLFVARLLALAECSRHCRVMEKQRGKKKGDGLSGV